MTDDDSKCGLLDEHMKICCCACIHHRPDHSHPSIDGFSIMNQKGWACVPPGFNGRIFSGWAKHGACELFTKQ